MYPRRKLVRARRRLLESLARAAAHSNRAAASWIRLAAAWIRLAAAWIRPRLRRSSPARAHSCSSEGVFEESGAGDTMDFAMFTDTGAKISATFYPKFENEKSDQETRNRMIEMVSNGLAYMEVTLKHSGSLFMYAGHGGAYAKNSFRNIYTAVGVFVLARMFREAWGKEAPEMQAEFNKYLEENRINISMELVTAVLGDHGQRPKEDYAVVTAVTELGHGKPKFYSTSEVIAFCQKWRLTANHVWLFSKRESAASFFTKYDALCEEGTATTVCEVLDEIADISVPGSKDHAMVQGEILEGLVARIVSRKSSVQIKEVLRKFSPPALYRADSDLGPNLREICVPNRSYGEQEIEALLDKVGPSMCPDHCDWFRNNDLDVESKKVVTCFLQAHPRDNATKKLQEMILLLKQRRFRAGAAIKCYRNDQKDDSLSNDNSHYKMVIHARDDSVFKRYQQEMRKNQGLWPLYRGFFIDVKLFKVNNEKVVELSKDNNITQKNIEGSLDSSLLDEDGLADEDTNLMVKLKFLTYKIRTFLIRGGISTLFNDGHSAYKAYYLRQMKIWGTSRSKQEELCKLLDGWAVYITGKCGDEPLSSQTYLSEAEPFLEQYAKYSDLVQTENFLAEARKDEEDDLQSERGAALSSPTTSLDVVSKTEGLIVFFPGSIGGCGERSSGTVKGCGKGDIKTPDTAERRVSNIIFAAVTLSKADILVLVRKIAEDTDVNNFLNGIKLEDNLNEVHVTLAHKRSHGADAVSSYGVYQNQEVPVSFNALVYTDNMAALEAQLGMVNGETVVSRNAWPHCTLWTATSVAAMKANTLRQLVSEKKAKRVPIDPPITISGVLNLRSRS